MLTDTMLRALHAWYRKDKWVKALYDAMDADMSGVDGKLMQDYYNLFFDKLDEDGCKVLEKDLGLTPAKDATLDMRRSDIQINWLAKQFASMPAIQQICDGIYNGSKSLISLFLGAVTALCSDSCYEFCLCHGALPPIKISACIIAYFTRFVKCKARFFSVFSNLCRNT